ncbi:MAG: hypothetical protein M3209_19645 [Acidobacteriota bacterium]|nr:hypothetical protein [Acidobacteriota bacterium]
MTAEEFVDLFAKLRDSLLKDYFVPNSQLEVAVNIASLNLTCEQNEIAYRIVKGVLTDALYTVLLGLDGEAAIGGTQISYKLYDEDGNELTGTGLIEAFAWEKFQANF